jgi:hypothetical protein
MKNEKSNCLFIAELQYGATMPTTAENHYNRQNRNLVEVGPIKLCYMESNGEHLERKKNAE